MESTDQLVSVVVPCHNDAGTIGLCIRAVRAQTYPSIEIIVVDDASTDRSAELAESAGAVVVRSAANQGLAASRNLGAAHSRGAILFFLDSDIALDRGSVEAAVRVLRSEPAVGAVCGALDAEPLVPAGLPGQYRAVQQYVWFNEVDGAIPVVRAAVCAIRTEVFDEIGPFDPNLRHTEDQDYGYRLGRRYEIRSAPAVHGRHDHRTSLATILRKVFHRTRLGIPLWLRHRSLPGGAATGPRALASAGVLAAALAAPLPWLVGPAGAAVPAGLLAAAVVLDRATYRYAFASRGLAFGLYFVGVHLLVNLVSAVAAGTGTLQYLLSRPRRPAGVPVGSSPGGGA